jgi:probable rRNA maturation factor
MISISNTTKFKPGTNLSGFDTITNSILGKKYDLSLVFIGNTKSRNLNKKFRKKDYPTNVLSFPLDNESGEIFINIAVSKKEAKECDLSLKKYIITLFIHGLLHLKGLDHGEEMTKLEKKFEKKFL